MSHFVFPKWSNKAVRGFMAFAGVFPIYVLCLLYYGGRPTTTDVGYAPKQPVPYSHALHAGQLGIDCRYCHNTVERTAAASIPPTQTCLNCHNGIRKNSEKLQPVWDSIGTGMPVEWVRVHDLPDYAYFNHSAHVTRGIGCVSCHGRIDKMEVVDQEKPLSMGWCLDCHRNPEKYLRPLDKIADMDWQAEDQLALGKEIMVKNQIQPSTDCSTCHR